MSQVEMRFDICLTADELNLAYNTLLNAEFKGNQAPVLALLLGKMVEAGKRPRHVLISDQNVDAEEEDGRKDDSEE